MNFCKDCRHAYFITPNAYEVDGPYCKVFTLRNLVTGERFNTLCSAIRKKTGNICPKFSVARFSRKSIVKRAKRYKKFLKQKNKSR